MVLLFTGFRGQGIVYDKRQTCAVKGLRHSCCWKNRPRVAKATSGELGKEARAEQRPRHATLPNPHPHFSKLMSLPVESEALRPALPRVGRLISKASGILSPMTQDKKDVRQPWAEKRSLLPHSLMPNCSFFQQIRPRTPRATFFRAPVNTSSSVLAS